jgi:hypothetical protein
VRRDAQCRDDMTTIWVSKRAAEALARECGPGAAAAAVVDRLRARQIRPADGHGPFACERQG